MFRKPISLKGVCTLVPPCWLHDGVLDFRLHIVPWKIPHWEAVQLCSVLFLWYVIQQTSTQSNISKEYRVVQNKSGICSPQHKQSPHFFIYSLQFGTSLINSSPPFKSAHLNHDLIGINSSMASNYTNVYPEVFSYKISQKEIRDFIRQKVLTFAEDHLIPF